MVVMIVFISFLCLSRKVKSSVFIDGTPIDFCDGFVVGRGNNNNQPFFNIYSLPLTLFLRAINSLCFISNAFFLPAVKARIDLLHSGVPRAFCFDTLSSSFCSSSGSVLHLRLN